MERLLLILALILALILVLGLSGKVVLLRHGIRQLRKDLEEHFAQETNTLLDTASRDRELRQLASCLNTQLRLLRQQRHQYLSGDRELKEAVTNISHDLRTPLTAICGYLDLMKQEILPENQQRYLSLIQNRVDAMRQLTEELLRYSVILSRQELDLQEVCINDVLEESIAGCYAGLVSRNIQPRLDICQQRVERTLNREALGRVFGNILSNALKYSDGDLAITLSADGSLCFSNRASQLDEIQVGRLFDRFFTVETGRNANGLGLSIAKTLTQQMGGTIQAVLQEGTLSICLTFPECRPAHALPASRSID